MKLRCITPQLATQLGKWRKIKSDRRDANKANIAASGTGEDYGELQQTIDDLFQEFEEDETKHSDMKSETSMQAKALDILYGKKHSIVCGHYQMARREKEDEARRALHLI